MVGFGYDSHRLEKGQSLILAGIEINSEIGTVAHSDGDAVCHAVTDALLGASALGDIGEHFPDTDDRYKNADSIELLRNVVDLLISNGFKIINIDVSIILERPKLLNYKQKMKQKLANTCNLPYDRVSVKAKTNEKMDSVGDGTGVVVYAVCQIDK